MPPAPSKTTSRDRSDVAIRSRWRRHASRSVSDPSSAPTARSGSALRPNPCATGQDLCHGGVTALDAILETIGDARSSPARPRRLLLNPKFFRNGIVMLVLVVGTAALLFTWIQSNG